MRKSDKKLDNDIRKQLTEVCEQKLKTIDGFEWLTHTVNYSNFPASLRIFCVFDTNVQLQAFAASADKDKITEAITKALSSLKIKLPPRNKLVNFDSEENCQREHRGNWQARLA